MRNEKAIQQWITDLLDPKFGIVFNLNYECIRDDKNRLVGDGSLFLAYRFADIQSDDQLYTFYEELSVPKGGYHAAEVVVNRFTGIPLEDACKLMWPHDLIEDPDFDIEKVKPKEFVAVLKHYLKTGDVDWKMSIK